jgi:hypothetical protein
VRRRILTPAVLLAVLAAAVGLNIPHGPVVANLSDIVNRPEAWTGTRVQATGELVRFGGCGAIQDAHQDRIGVRLRLGGAARGRSARPGCPA